jgi:predicted small integral membrane protein
MPEPTLHDHPLASGRSVSTPTRSTARLLLIAGPVVLAVAAVLLFAGWWGASDTTNPGEQLPYFASATVPGLAVALLGCALILRAQLGRVGEETRALTERFDVILEWLASASDASPQPNGAQPESDTEPLRIERDA